MSHSKRNTSRPVFTAHERSLAKAAWGSSSARLSRESFLPFASCGLCLEPAIDPVACTHGDMFCRECALSNILAQKKEIKRAEKAREHEERQALEDKARRELEEQERAIREFELTQAGLDIQSGSHHSRTETSRPEGAAEPKRGEKRKFSLDEDEVARIAAEQRTKARKAMDDEKASKPTLPSFWSPSVTPSLNKSDIIHDVKKKVKSQPVCPAAPEDKPHYYSLHTLVTINFSEEKDPKSKVPQRICPACTKSLSNSSRATLAKPCGHVLCKSCVDKFMKPSDHHDPHAPEVDPNSIRCYVCEADLTEKSKEGKDKIKPGLVELRREGTGFSAGGANEVKKDQINFRC
ncbi:zinc finger containing protein [Echria macrotheca]|uniref:Zinc finger containing protein n=1 Tax=Echria macrotheca TaxID=438768 RepID=A0AAJ0BD12_9PEZI|nr:zinc finger containing protein [Echria macrotheca]